MKLETREVTVTKEFYVADDGTIFLDKCECEAHEFFLAESKLSFYDGNYEKSDLESCTYVKLITDDDVESLRKLCEYGGVSLDGLRGPGIYMYTNQFGNPDCWVNITEAVEAIYGGKA